MAIQGYIIGISEDTSTAPTLFWSGVSVAQTPEIDNASFLPTLRVARIAAGTLQSELPESHVAVYPVTKTIGYNNTENSGT